MALDIGELRGSISLNDTFSSGIEAVAGKMGMAGESFSAIAGFAGIAVTAIAGVTGAVVALGMRGADVADVRGAFENLTAAAGQSAEMMLGELRAGTLGTVSDFDLMSKATPVLSAGLLKTKEDMGTLAAGAQLLADRTGGDTAEAFGTLTSAIASGRTTQLTQMGLFVDTKKAVEDYAREHGKLPGALTQTEEKMAIAAATVAALKGQLSAAGPASADFGDNIKRGQTAVQNFTDGLGEAIAKSPVVQAGMSAVSTALSAAFGGEKSDLVKTLMGYVNEFAIGLTYVAQTAVVVAGGFVQGWYLMKTVVLGVITAVSGFATALVTIVTGLAEMAAKVPGASAVVGDLAAGAKALSDDMSAVTLSLAEETAEAARGAAGHSELQGKLDAVGGAILTVREEMEKARDVTAETTEATVPLKGALDNVGTAAGLTKEQIKAMEDQTNESMATMAESWTASSDLQRSLQEELALLQTSGTDRRRLELQQQQQEEMAGIQNLAFEYPARYAEIAAAITEKYRIMGEAAKGYHDNIVVQASMAGFQTRTEMEAVANNAKDTYERMLESGKFTFTELQKAHKAAKDAEDAVNKTSAVTAKEQYEIIAAGATSILRTVFGKNKAAGIAAAVIDTAQAVTKALASAPWPLNLIPAAAAGAAGLVQINKIRSTEPGFAQGTGPGGEFRQFGSGTAVTLHHEEAVVTRKQGSSIAGMVEDSLANRDVRTEAGLQRVVDAIERQDRNLPRQLRDAMQLALA